MTRNREYTDNVVKRGKSFSKHQIRMIEAIAERMENDEPVGRRRAERALGAMALGIIVDQVVERDYQANQARRIASIKAAVGVK